MNIHKNINNNILQQYIFVLFMFLYNIKSNLYYEHTIFCVVCKWKEMIVFYIMNNIYLLLCCLISYLDPLHSNYVCWIFAELLGIDTMPNTFTYYELNNATSDFNRDNKLGEGGFGPVYKVNILMFLSV
jgi:hypothetical protein